VLFTRRRAAAVLVFALACVVANTSPSSPTFTRDVLPILQKRCELCHRPGAVAPMSFLTYESTRPWAKAIKEAVLTKRMPPWPADPQYGHFANDRTLKSDEIDTLVGWVNGGAAKGDEKDMPAPVEWRDGWIIPPDVVISMPEPFPIPANGVVELTSFTIPTGFTRDTWITSIEIRPGNRSVVHHVSMAIVPHSAEVIYGLARAEATERDAAGVQVHRVQKADRLAPLMGLEATYDPGTTPTDFRPYQAGKLIRAGLDLVIQMHYTPTGRATTDQTRIGFTLAKEKPVRQFVTVVPTALRDAAHFHISPRDPNWESRTAVVFQEAVEIVWLMPHMHLRGKDMTYQLICADGQSQTLLRIKWDFNWQLGYALEKPITSPKGSRLEVIAHFDNSVNNPLNPNPDSDVWWGDQTWEEMMVPWFGVLARPNTDSSSLVNYAPEIRKRR
jgi:hypothetical protein